MARATVIREAEQAEYRLRQECSEDHARQRDAQVAYRLGPDGPRPIERIGRGWTSFDRTPGAPLGPDELDEVRAVMDGRDPRTGERLVVRKTRVAPAGKLPALPLLEEMARRKLVPAPDTWARKRARRLIKMTRADTAHTAAYRDLVRVASSVGLRLKDVPGYGVAQLAYAKQHADDREVIGARGWDLRLDTGKDVGALWALGTPQVSREIEEAVLAAARETVAEVEKWVARGQRGQHGDGKVARRVDTSGLIGTLTLHTTARPVDGIVDPHLHVHVMLPNLGLGTDGQWGGVAAGGRELFEAVPAAGALMRARTRAHLTARLGVRWRETTPGQWVIVGVPQQVRDLYSRRRDQALAGAGKKSTAAQRRLAAKRSAAAKASKKAGDPRVEWVQRARSAGLMPEAIVAAAVRRPEPAPEPDPSAATDRAIARLATRYPTRAVSHAAVMSAAADAAPAGMTATEQAAVADAVARRMRPTGAAGGAHLKHSQHYRAPVVAMADARAGRGPAAVATAPKVADLQARREAALRRAAQARAEAEQLKDAAARPTTAWRRGMTRASARTEVARLTGVATEAVTEASRLGGHARRLQERAVAMDVATATAQDKARQAVKEAQALAAARQAARTSMTRPRPRQPRIPGDVVSRSSAAPERFEGSRETAAPERE
ncbi:MULTISPECIES: MobF family relaxase [unclassified Nocardiopsis]|uniref:MobF family relaxase n=1 Tax=unclassified Nocardiopsis TaxID=2649073 RepID=UPI0013585C67|nr:MULTISPECIES: MobF family relaxase [unclassified Nocardiopsis]